MKKQTLEEAAEAYFLQEYSWNGKDSLPYKEEDVKLTKESFIAGAKYQAEKVNELLDILLNENMCSVIGDELIKQFKKEIVWLEY